MSEEHVYTEQELSKMADALLEELRFAGICRAFKTNKRI